MNKNSLWTVENNWNKNEHIFKMMLSTVVEYCSKVPLSVFQQQVTPALYNKGITVMHKLSWMVNVFYLIFFYAWLGLLLAWLHSPIVEKRHIPNCGFCAPINPKLSN